MCGIICSIRKEKCKDDSVLRHSLDKIKYRGADASGTFLSENKKVAKEGGNVAKQARLTLEKQTGKSVISSENAKNLQNKEKKKLMMEKLL